MTIQEIDQVMDRYHAKPRTVQVVIRMLAIMSRRGAPIESDEDMAAAVRAGLNEWEGYIAELPPETLEAGFAEELIAQVRRNQPDGGGRILRGNAQ